MKDEGRQLAHGGAAARAALLRQLPGTSTGTAGQLPEEGGACSGAAVRKLPTFILPPARARERPSLPPLSRQRRQQLRCSKLRRAISLHLPDGENQFREFRRADGGVVCHNHATIVRRTPQGTRDYAEPEVLPTLWQE